MTLVEVAVVLVVLLVIAVSASLLLPRLSKATGGPRNRCGSNLKQVALASRLWAGDHDELFPWQVTTNRGGTLELGESTNTWKQWFAMRRELESPRILFCSSDLERPATIRNFTNPGPPASYVINFSAAPNLTNGVLSSDRNLLRDGKRLRAGLHEVGVQSKVKWDTDIHRSVGNLAFTDGSVRQTTSDSLQQAFRNSPLSTNRLVIP